MEKNREGYLVSDTHRECTKCGAIFEITSKMTLCKTCNSNRVKSLSPEWKMHQRAKARCKENGREFSLSVEDVLIPDICPVLGIKLNMNSGKSGAYRNSPSLDRVDNSKGYTKENIQVISQLANAMKCHATNEELHKFAHWVLSTIPATN
jgi:predicted  nucleic acid-binding Zn-ribbon protein